MILKSIIKQSKRHWRKFVYAKIAIYTVFALGAARSLQIPSKANDISPIKVGERIPDITLTDMNGQPFHLLSEVQRQPTVLIYYRGGWCPYCNRHLGELQQLENQLAEMGFQILAISADKPAVLRSYIHEKRIGYKLLSDSTMAGAEAFGLAWKMGDKQVARYKKMGHDLEAASGLKHHILPVPAALVLNTSGEVVYAFIDPNYRKRIDPGDLAKQARKALEEI